MQDQIGRKDGWWGRNGLCVAVMLALPVIFSVMSGFAGGLTPDTRCAICLSAETPKHEAGSVDDQERARKRVEAWVAYSAKKIPTLSTLPLAVAWAKDQTDAEKLATLDADLRARYGYAVPTGLLVLVSLVASVIVIRLLSTGSNLWLRIAIVSAVLLAAMGLIFQDSHSVRVYSAEFLLGKIALDPRYPFLTPHTWEVTFAMINVVTVAAMAATGLLIVLFASIAQQRSDLNGAEGRRDVIRRARTFKIALIMGSLVLVLAVASTHGLFGWAAVLMEEKAGEAIHGLGASAALYWGVIHSLFLVGVSAPTALAIHLDIRRVTGESSPLLNLKALDDTSPGGAETPLVYQDPPVGSAPEQDKETAEELAEAAGFKFNPRQTFSTLMVLAGPALTGPFLEILTKFPFGAAG